MPHPLQDATEALATFLAHVLTVRTLRCLLCDYILCRYVEGRVASLSAGRPLEMQLEQAHLCEAFATLGAEEGSLPGVNALMSGQIPGVLEALSTFLAGVRSLACVGPLVTDHVRGTCEGFATLLARVWVGPVMDGERLWELRTLRPPLGDLSSFCSCLHFAILFRVTEFNVLQQVRLLHVEERTLRAGKDLGGHLHSGTYAKNTRFTLLITAQLESWFC